MSKYTALTGYLHTQGFSEVRMTFAEIERVIGAKLPPKAQLHRAWWSNNPSNNVMTKAWLDAGFRSEQVDMPGRKLVFRREADSKHAAPKHFGVEEPMHAFQHVKTPLALSDGHHPAIGSMKGMITGAGDAADALPYAEEEWARIESEIEGAKNGGPVLHHPLVGLLRGTTKIMPGVDIMEPAFADEDWDAFIERKAKLIEDGLKRT